MGGFTMGNGSFALTILEIFYITIFIKFVPQFTKLINIAL